MTKTFTLKFLPFFILLFTFNLNLRSQTCPSFSYGGRTYKTVQLGTQCWMAENLAMPKHSEGKSTSYGATSKTLSDKRKNEIAQIFGGLYDYAAASFLELKIPGWHMPTDKEWEILIKYLGGEEVATQKMKSKTGFNLLFGGQVDNQGTSQELGTHAYFWSSTTGGNGNAKCWIFQNVEAALIQHGDAYADNMYSVRLVKD